MLIDTGPDETYLSLRSRMLEIPVHEAGKRKIDLRDPMGR
jgi:hypothetical protein